MSRPATRASLYRTLAGWLVVLAVTVSMASFSSRGWDTDGYPYVWEGAATTPVTLRKAFGRNPTGPLAASCGKPGGRERSRRGWDHKRGSTNHHLTGRGQTYEFSNRTSDGGAGRASDALDGRLFQHHAAEQRQHVQGRRRDVLAGDVPAGRQPAQRAEDVRGSRRNVLLGRGLLRSGRERLEVLTPRAAGRPARSRPSGGGGGRGRLVAELAHVAGSALARELAQVLLRQRRRSPATVSWRTQS